MKIFKKILVSFTTILVFSSAYTLNTIAAAAHVDSSSEGIKTTGMIQPKAELIHVDKPIAEVRYVSNYQLGKMIEHYNKYSNWLSAVNAVILASGPSAVAGSAVAIATILGNNPEHLRAAYYQGKHAYYVVLYANGKPNSLSKICYTYYTTDTLVFRYP